MSLKEYKLSLEITKLISNVVRLLGKIGLFTTEILSSLMATAVTGLGIIVTVIGVIISISSWLDNLSDLKKGRDTCYYMYRRIRSLIEFTNPNEIIYKQLKAVTGWTEKTLLVMKQIISDRQKDLVMTKKLFVPAEFNSFILYQNIISWIDFNEAVMTANNGAYNDYIKFVSVTDYIDTHNIFEKDKARLEMIILDNNVDIMAKFLLSIETLIKELEDRQKDVNLTQWTKKDISNVLEYAKLLKSIFTENGELYNNLKSQLVPKSDDIASLMLSIFRFIDYGYAIDECGYNNLSTIYSQDDIFGGQDITTYLQNFAGFEWILNILSPYMIDYGISIFNDIYIDKYKTEIKKSFEKNPNLYSEDFYNKIQEQLKSFDYLQNNFYQYNCLLQILEYFINKDYHKINSVMTTYLTYKENSDQIKAQKPEIENYITFNYDNIYNYLLSQKQNQTYNKYFEISNLFNDKQTYNIDVGSAWLETNTYHWSDVGQWGSDISLKREYTLKQLLELPYSTEEYFLKEILSNKKFFKVIFVNAFQIKNSRGYCGSLEDLADVLFNNGFNDINKLKDNNLCLNFILKATRNQYIPILNLKNYGTFYFNIDDYKTAIEKTIKNEYPYYLNYSLTSSSNKYSSKDLYYKLKDTGLYTLLYNSYLDTFGKYGFDKINAKREEVFNDLLSQDIKLVYGEIIEPIVAHLSFFEITNSNFTAIFKDQLTDKYKQKLFNLFIKCLTLLKSNFGKYVYKNDSEQVKPLILPYYNLIGKNLYFEGFIKPIDILEKGYNRTDISDLFYALNAVSFDTLFDYAEGNFYKELMQIEQSYELRADNYEIVTKYKQIQDYLLSKMEKLTDNYSKQDLINSFNQEMIEQEIFENDRLIKEGVIVNIKPNIENEKIANKVQQEISETNILIDKKILKKYTIYGLLGFSILQNLRRK